MKQVFTNILKMKINPNDMDKQKQQIIDIFASFKTRKRKKELARTHTKYINTNTKRMNHVLSTCGTFINCLCNRCENVSRFGCIFHRFADNRFDNANLEVFQYAAFHHFALFASNYAMAMRESVYVCVCNEKPQIK